ncbi:hypothetical protein ACFTQ7_17530 [Lysinibacillus sp. NPDC056959]|uniref:hypothetical protein n=1 Tax=Lysinibacillus sp. NPDC056959 TaxID=3345981 RepID=UPI003635C9CB
MVINLHTTQSPVSRSERMKINENWQKIIEGLSKLQFQINLLAGGEEVEELLKRITDAINGAIEAATNANAATSNANVAADAANQIVQTAIEKITVVEELLIKLEVQQDEWEHIKSSLILVSEAAKEATTNANSATMNANQASDAANAAKENLTNAVTTKLNEADTAITNANTAATTATQASESIKGWGTATAWNSTTGYLKNNVVTYNGSTWQAKADNTNSVPTITNTNWIILAQRGVDGKGSVASVNGKLPDENGNVTLDFGAGTVQKVNGKNPDEKGEVTLVADDLGMFSGNLLENNSVSMQKLTQEVIDAINAGGSGVGNSFFVPYPLVTTEVSQKSWSLPVGAYDAATDSLLVFHNAGVLAPESWTITGTSLEGYTVNIPDNPIVAIGDNNVLLLVLKNTPNNLPEDISGTRLIDDSVGLSKLNQEVQDAINNAGTKIDIIPTLDSSRTDAALAASVGKDLKSRIDNVPVVQISDDFNGGTEKAASAETVKTLNQNVSSISNKLTTHEGVVASTNNLGHMKPDGTTITVTANGTATAKQVTIVNDLTTGGSDKAASAETVKTLNTKVSQIVSPSNLMNDTVTIYVSSTGNDSNDGLSAAKPVKTIAKAVSLIKPLGAKKRTIQLNGGDTFNEVVTLEGVHGSTIEINGTYGNKATVKGFDFTDCSAPIRVLHIDVNVKGNVTSVAMYTAIIDTCARVSMYSGNYSGSSIGIMMTKSYVELSGLNLSNIEASVIEAKSGSYCLVDNISGTNPSAYSYSYSADASIIIGSAGTVTSKVAQHKRSGGQIFF